MLKRYLSDQIQNDLSKKMVFVGGPRQVGKTTLAKSLLPDLRGYLNWDISEDREQILNKELPPVSMWVFDELHKYRQWRNFLKGLYDGVGQDHRILVTGSARLDYYRYSGDSLQGRYHYLRLHPLSLAELPTHTEAVLLELLEFGGFPEPFFAGTKIEAKRWSREYRTRLIREELIQLERVHDIGTLEQLALRLPELVGSPLSINALREDLQVSHKTVASWLHIFERLYSIFRLSPFGSPKIQAVKKEQKHYHYDWSLIPNMSMRFENLVASALLKWVQYLQDTQGEEIDLRYFRDVEKREIDFVIVQGKSPLKLIECKWNDADISASLRYLKTKFPQAEAWQISAVGKKDYISQEGIRVCPAFKFLSTLV